MENTGEAWITTTDAAALAEVSGHTIRSWLRKYPAIGKRVGGRYRVKREAIEKIVAGEARIEDFDKAGS